MPSRWDGKVGKIPKVGEKRESKRFSPRVEGVEEQSGIHECRSYPIDEERERRGSPKEPGQAELYTPETVSQYKSQWARYQRALELNAAAIVKQGNKLIYKFSSCDSLTGFWEVEVTPGATYLKILKPILQILCPKPTVLDIIESDAQTFTWTQTRGSRSAQINGVLLKASEQSPAFENNPTLDLLSICLSNGCHDGSVEPVVINVQPEGQPELFDSITIYTTPTSTHYGNSFEVAVAAADADPGRKVTTLRPGAPLPQYLQRGYVANPPNTYMLTWDLPAAYPEFVTETVWQQNTTGQYLDVQRFPRQDNRLFVANLNTHYRVLSTFNVYGNASVSESQRFYFTNPNRVVVADDSLNGISATGLKTNITKLPLSRKLLTVEDKYDGISATGLKTNITKLPLSRKLLEAPIDTYNGISWTTLKTSVTKTQLGGMIIR
jgi:hypothetical protein